MKLIIFNLEYKLNTINAKLTYGNISTLLIKQDLILHVVYR